MLVALAEPVDLATHPHAAPNAVGERTVDAADEVADRQRGRLVTGIGCRVDWSTARRSSTIEVECVLAHGGSRAMVSRPEATHLAWPRPGSVPRSRHRHSSTSPVGLGIGVAGWRSVRRWSPAPLQAQLVELAQRLGERPTTRPTARRATPTGVELALHTVERVVVLLPLLGEGAAGTAGSGRSSARS